MIGDYIILKRKELNIKRKDLAEELGVTYNYLNLIETNKRKVGKKQIPKLAKALGVTEEELIFYNTNSNENGYKMQKRLIKKQIESINIQIAKLDTDRLLLEKERDFLCDKIVVLDNAENQMKEVLASDK